MDDLQKKKEDLKELEELAKELEDCKGCLGNGDGKEAAKKLVRMARKNFRR